MNTKTTKVNLVNSRYQNQKERLLNTIDNLLIERLPDLVSEELNWIRKEFRNDEVSDFLDGDDYYLYSPVLNELIKNYSLPFKNELEISNYQIN